MPPLVVDTREKKPYRFPGIDDVINEPLDVGDYTHDGFQHTYAVERKSLDDFAQSLGTDRLRFENEVRRANGYAECNQAGNPLPGSKPDYGGLEEFAVVIEADRTDVSDYADMLDREGLSIGQARGQALNGQRYVPYLQQIHPNAILGTVREWPQRYDQLEFHWATDREEAKQRTLQLLDTWYLRYGGSR